MTTSRNTLYVTATILCLSGYLYLLVIYVLHQVYGIDAFGVCMMKGLTTIPCPSCGSTGAIFSLLKGDVQGALTHNPIGLFLAVIMFITPVWITRDVLFKKETFWRFYQEVQTLFRKKTIVAAFVLLVLANWAWNISKTFPL